MDLHIGSILIGFLLGMFLGGWVMNLFSGLTNRGG